MSQYTTAPSASYTTTNRAMSVEQFEQVVTAIIEGKYSWACVLILRYTGYNPAHYLPYRTYKRLIKDNCPPPAEALSNRPSNIRVRPEPLLCMAVRQ